MCKVREELPLLLQNTLNAHGAQTLSVSKFIPSIVTGLSDSQVRPAPEDRTSPAPAPWLLAPRHASCLLPAS